MQVHITVPNILLAERTDVVYWSLTVEIKLKKILTRRSQRMCKRVQLRAKNIQFGIETKILL